MKKPKTRRMSIRITEENGTFLDQFENMNQVISKALDRYRREVIEIQNLKKRIEISKETK